LRSQGSKAMRIKYLPILFLLVCGWVCLFSQTSDPILMINTEMHTASIQTLSVDANERLLLSTSLDKTARLWDLVSGELLRVFRPPVGMGKGGMLYSGDISPDGQYAVVGGWDNYIYVFRTSDGKMTKRIGRYPNSVFSLQFSPDGSFLVAGLGVDGGVLIYRSADWQEVKKLDVCGNSVKNINFDGAGNLVTTSWDGKLCLFNADFELLRTRTFPKESMISRISFNPDGSKLVICFSYDPQILVLSAEDLSTLYQPDVADANELYASFIIANFSSTGNELIAGGYYMVDTGPLWKSVIRVWQDAGKGDYVDYPLGLNTITNVTPLKDGCFVFSSSYPEWGRLNSNKILEVAKRSVIINNNTDNKSSFKVNNNADEIGFTPLDLPPHSFSVMNRAIISKESNFPSFTDSIPGVRVTDWEYGNIKVNGEDLRLTSANDKSYCVDVVSENKILFGGIWDLYCYDKKGICMWKTSTQSIVLMVKSAGNGLTAVTGIIDGTFRWFRMSDGVQLLTLVMLQDMQHWILYTPSGYYDCSPGSESLIGWNINQGAEEEALFYPVDRFRDIFYRPDVIDRLLLTHDESEALLQANEAAGIAAFTQKVSDVLPPVIKIETPGFMAEFSNADVPFEYKLSNLNREPVTSLKVLVDGRPLMKWSNLNILESKGRLILHLPPRNVCVGIIAENKFGKSEMDYVRLLWKGEASLTEKEKKPNLYVLAVGITDYEKEKYDLLFAAKDANDFSSVIGTQKDLMYNKVSLRLLTDKQASRDNILSGLDWLKQNCTAEDVAMIFLSGHGVNDNVGRFYYLPFGADVEYLRATCVPFKDFEETLSAIPGKVILFVDACHSGSLDSGIQTKPPDVTRLINEASSDDVGVVIFTSSTTRQSSYENAAWQNGAFTKALVEGLTGKADYVKSGSISLKELDLYISTRVKELAEEIGKEQTPTTIVPQSIPDFDIGMVP
jgi:WD40 repeat protein